VTASPSRTASSARPAGWTFCAILLATVAAFFLAARFLPPIDTHAMSVAVAAGYTNQLLPLVAILLGGAALMAIYASPAEQPRPTAKAVPFWRWHILAAAGLCVAVVVLVPIWSQPQNYFGERVTLMDAGQRPYVDFEYAYGALVAYLPYGLHAAGLPIQTALEATLCLAVVAGVWAFAVTTECWIPDWRFRLVLCWSLTACEGFVDPGPSLNYNFGRYALPFALMILVTRATLRTVCGQRSRRSPRPIRSSIASRRRWDVRSQPPLSPGWLSPSVRSVGDGSRPVSWPWPPASAVSPSLHRQCSRRSGPMASRKC
jgi:hypothetical protein